MNSSSSKTLQQPVMAWTIGDVAGIGPELIVKAWTMPEIQELCRPIVFGSAPVLMKTARELGIPIDITVYKPDDITSPEACEVLLSASPSRMPCIDLDDEDVSQLAMGQVHAGAGRLAYVALAQAADWALKGMIDAIVTLPLHKEGLHQAGYDYPGHTEILADLTAAPSHAMMLYRRGLGVVHVTLHTALRKALDQLSTEANLEKILLLEKVMRQLGVDRPRLAVAALNPHASDGGLFGNEEELLIAPAVREGKGRGIDVMGPIPADTLFVRAAAGEFDGVVAQYHDQGHIALKLLGWREAVNITLGLPIIRTSVAHGTAYDICGRGVADPTSLLEAVRVAAKLCQARNRLHTTGP